MLFLLCSSRKIGLLLCSHDKAACLVSFASSFSGTIFPTPPYTFHSEAQLCDGTSHLKNICDQKFLASSESLLVLNSRFISPDTIFFCCINRLFSVWMMTSIYTHLNIFPGSSLIKWYLSNDIEIYIVARLQIDIFGKQA